MIEFLFWLSVFCFGTIVAFLLICIICLLLSKTDFDARMMRTDNYHKEYRGPQSNQKLHSSKTYRKR